MRRSRALAAAMIVAAVAAVASPVPAMGAARDLSAVSGVITPKTVNKAPEVRVNQVGYPASAPKAAFAMLPRPVAAVRFEVTTQYGVAYRGTSTDNLGSWNSADRAVYQLGFSGVRTPGRYQVKLLSPASAVSPAFTIGDGAQVYRQLVDNAVQYFTTGDPFALGTQLGASAFGLFITDALYQKYGGSSQFESFAQQQLNFALGANDWGSSFVVGAGTVFPHCMQIEIANLAGSLTGTGNIQLGTTTDGPSSPANFTGLGTVSGMRACSAGNFAPFTTKTAAYEDNVVSWPSVEPADDYTANSLLAFALGGDQGSGLG